MADRPKAVRDRAIVRLLYNVALRRGEVVSLDVSHVDLEAATLMVLGKGRTEREPLAMPPVVVSAMRDWLDMRGLEPGPLFVNFDRARKGGRLTGKSVERIVAKLGSATGQRVRPHGLRHAAITRGLDATGGDVRAVQRFSRHRDVRVLMAYDDNRSDLGGKVARLISDDI